MMIQVTNIKKVFSYSGLHTVALGGISMQVEQGEFVAIMGPSGCGKTTLLNILGLLDNPTEGSYLLNGVEVAHLKERQRTDLRKGNIGFVFQSFNLIEELTVEQNVELPLKYMKVPAAERRTRVSEALRKLNISHRAMHFPYQLSGGQQQRVAIARAVVCEPSLVLADEPTANLDTRNGKEVMELLASLNDDGTTIIMATHSQRGAAYAQRTINMLDGFLVEKTEL